MKKFGMTCLSVLALCAASTANASTYRAPGTYTLSGPVNVTLGATPPMTCNVSITLQVDNLNPDGHTAADFEHALGSDPNHGHDRDNAGNVNGRVRVTGMTISGGPLGICGVATLSGLPYNVSHSGASHGGTLNVSGVVANAPFGITCGGNLTGTWNNGNVTFVNAVLPGASGNCTFSGTLAGSPKLDIDATPAGTP